MSCYQNLTLNNNTGDLSITSGNTVNLVQAIQTFGIKTPVVDFSISGSVISLYYRDVTGAMQIKQVLLPVTTGGNTTISVASTPSISASIANGVISSNINISTTAGNTVLLNADGIYVASSGTIIQVETTPSITMTYSGGVLGSILNISAASGNTATLNTDGLFVPPNTVSTAQIRNTISATAPVAYNATTGVVSLSQASGTTNGWLSLADWITFNIKLGGATTVSSVSAVPILSGVVSGVVQTRGLTAGTGIAVNLLSQDIVLSTTATVPSVNAGPNQQVPTPATSTTMAATATVSNGFIVSTTWLLLSGPNVPVITDASSPTTSITGLVVGNYGFRLLANASTGLVGTDDMFINVYSGSAPLDVIYIGVQSGSTPPNAGTIVTGNFSQQNGANDVSADWTALTATTPFYCWFAIPNNGGTYFKTKWFVNSFDQGNIGTINDTFGPYTQVTINGIVYNVGITNFATQWTGVVLLQA